MFDAIAPRYDLVNRIMTFRLDVGWRRQVRPVPGAGRRRPPCSTWRAAPATSAGSWPGRATSRSASTCASGCWPPPAPTRRSLQADALRLPLPDGSRRRGHLRLRPAQLRRPRRVLRRAGPGGAARRPHRPARGGRARPTRCCGGATPSTSARSSPASAGCCPTRAAYRYLPKSVAYLPEPPRAACRRSGDAGFPDAERTPALAAASPSCSPAPGHDPARRAHPPARRRRRPARRRRRRRRAVRAGRRRARRPRRGRCACPVAEAAEVLAAHRASTTRSAGPAAGRWPSAPCRSTARRWGGSDARRARRGRRAAPTTARGGSPRSGRRRDADEARRPTPVPSAPAGRRPEPPSRSAPVGPPQEWCDLVAAGHRGHRADGELDKVVLAREVVVEADEPLRRGRPSLARLRAAYPELLRRPRRRLRRRQPRAAGRRAAATSSGPTRWPAPRPAAATPTADARLGRRPAGVGHVPPRAPGHHRHGPRHAAALGAPTSTTRPSRRSSPWPTCSTWPPWWRAGCRTRRRRCSSWSGPAPDAGGVRASPRRGALAFIAELEGFDRGRYAGAVGWVDADGNGDWAVGIRCAELDGTTAHGLRRQRHRRRQRSRHRAAPRPGPSSRRSSPRSSDRERHRVHLNRPQSAVRVHSMGISLRPPARAR